MENARQNPFYIKVILGTVFLAISAATTPQAAESASKWRKYPKFVQVILENADPLKHDIGDRLPLFLWPAHGGMVEDESLQEAIVRDLNKRGIAMIATWDPGVNRQKSLEDSMRVARIQQRLGLRVCVNANACMYGFYSGGPDTAHIDPAGKPFFDKSIQGGKIGCPFRIKHRFPVLREKVEFFVNKYHEANLPLDFVFGDWEIDGPLEVNRAWESSRRCVVCQENITAIEDFRVFQKAIREKRSEATRYSYSTPILNKYPNALVGNYAVYPNDGYRYWYDYFEVFYDAHPHRKDQLATYREWFDDYPLTGYSMAMPVIYPWARIHDWYDFPSTDYRWVHNMLLIASNAGKHTASSTPIIPFIHWNTVFDPGKPDSRIQQLSENAYKEMLWHALLRGTDTFFMWCPENQAAREVALAHAAWAESLEYRDWLDRGKPITFDIPNSQVPVISGLRIGDRVLARRTDFDNTHAEPIRINVDGKVLMIPRRTGNQILQLP